jgi:multidrug efflux pump subunit AcrB
MISATVGNGNGPNEADFIVKLTDRKAVSRRTQKQVEESIRERMRRIPGIQLSVGWAKPIQLAVLGPEADRLGPMVDEIMQRMAAIKGITELESSLTGANPAITLRVNNQLASDLGLSVQQIGTALRTFVAGETVSHWLAPDGQDYEVNVQLPRSERQRTADLGELSIASGRNGSDGKPIMVPLRQVVEFLPASSPKVINRQDLQRRAVISANVEDRPAGDVGTEVQQLTKSIKLPPGYRFDVGGDTKFMQESFGAALTALGIAVIFIYLILASQFGSFLPPVAIMASLPLSLIGVFLALLVTRSTLNIFSIIGFIMLMGLVTKNAILLVDFITQAQRQGMSQREAILTSGQVRLRPILMTSLAMIFGMLPMALGLGDAEQQASMGRAVIGGIVTSTLLTLVVVPVAYTYLDDWGCKALTWLQRRQAAAEVVSAADVS